MTRGYVIVINKDGKLEVIETASDSYLSGLGIMLLDAIKEGFDKVLINYVRDKWSTYEVEEEYALEEFLKDNSKNYVYVYEVSKRKLDIYRPRENKPEKLLSIKCTYENIEKFKLIFQYSSPIYYVACKNNKTGELKANNNDYKLMKELALSTIEKIKDRLMEIENEADESVYVSSTAKDIFEGHTRLNISYKTNRIEFIISKDKYMKEYEALIQCINYRQSLMRNSSKQKIFENLYIYLSKNKEYIINANVLEKKYKECVNYIKEGEERFNKGFEEYETLINELNTFPGFTDYTIESLYKRNYEQNTKKKKLAIEKL